MSLLGYGLAYLALLAAVGSGLVVTCTGRLKGGALLAPILGFGAMAAVLTSAAYVMPMKVAAWALLLPAAVVSLALAIWLGRTRVRLRPREVALPIVVVLVGLVISLLPGLLRGTEGPLALVVFDALGYMQAGEYLQEHTTQTGFPPGAVRNDLVEVYGYAVISGDQRIGVSAVNAAVSTIFGVEPDQTTYALLATLFSLLPLAIWVLSRALGATRPAAALGAAFGLSPTLLMLVADSALANLAGLVLAPPALYFGIRWVSGGLAGDLVAAGVLVGGLLATYPEFIPSILLAAAGGLIVLAVSAWPGSMSWRFVRTSAVRLLAVAAAAVVVAPIGAKRTVDYVIGIGSYIADQPDRFLTFENGWAWAFGVLHLYQLPRFDLLSDFRTTIAIGLPVILAALVVLGVVRFGLRRGAFVAIPISAAIIIGLVSYTRYQGGECQYCLWKSLTFLLPFLAVGLALGVVAAARLFRRPSLAQATGIGVGIIGLCGVALLGWADARLEKATYYAPSAIDSDLRELAANVDLPHHTSLLVEGSDTSGAPAWTTPAMYYLARGIDDSRVSFVADAVAASYLGHGPATGARFYSPEYRYILTPFGGVESNRNVIARRGPYAVLERARIDVTPVSTGWSFDPSDGSSAIPWVSAPFQLWISSPTAQTVALTVGLERPLDDGSTLLFSSRGEPVPALTSGDGSQLCVDLEAQEGLTILSAVPQLATTPSAPTRATESDPFPPPSKVLGLTSLQAEPGSCSQGSLSLLPPLRYGEGWYPVERDAQGLPFRWMGTSADLVVGENGLRRPRVRFQATVESLVVARRLIVSIAGRRVASILVPPDFAPARLAFEIPEGDGAVTIGLRAVPGARSASIANPPDTRLLAILVRDVSLERLEAEGNY